MDSNFSAKLASFTEVQTEKLAARREQKLYNQGQLSPNAVARIEQNNARNTLESIPGARRNTHRAGDHLRRNGGAATVDEMVPLMDKLDAAQAKAPRTAPAPRSQNPVGTRVRMTNTAKPAPAPKAPSGGGFKLADPPAPSPKGGYKVVSPPKAPASAGRVGSILDDVINPKTVAAAAAAVGGVAAGLKARRKARSKSKTQAPVPAPEVPSAPAVPDAPSKPSKIRGGGKGKMIAGGLAALGLTGATAAMVGRSSARRREEGVQKHANVEWEDVNDAALAAGSSAALAGGGVAGYHAIRGPKDKKEIFSQTDARMREIYARLKEMDREGGLETTTIDRLRDVAKEEGFEGKVHRNTLLPDSYADGGTLLGGSNGKIRVNSPTPAPIRMLKKGPIYDALSEGDDLPVSTFYHELGHAMDAKAVGPEKQKELMDAYVGDQQFAQRAYMEAEMPDGGSEWADAYGLKKDTDGEKLRRVFTPNKKTGLGRLEYEAWDRGEEMMKRHEGRGLNAAEREMKDAALGTYKTLMRTNRQIALSDLVGKYRGSLGAGAAGATAAGLGGAYLLNKRRGNRE